MQRLSSVILMIIGLGVSGLCFAQQADVQLQQVKISGTLQNGVFEFKGIPYAKAPVNKLRWQPPQPLDVAKNTINATQYGANCPQRTKKITSEDCLFINVFSQQTHTLKQPKSVLVWIHGGGYVGGSGDMGEQAIQHLVGQDLVLVSFNYRLGALGILAHPAIKSSDGANYSVMDMVAALNWVKTNIAAFGGDPQRVTIAGGSAGGMAVQMLMVTAKSDGLFQGAISQSGYGSWPLPRTDEVKPLADSADAEQLAVELVNRANHNRPVKNKSQLMALSAEQLVEAVQGFHLPVVDGITLTDEPVVQFKQGRQHKVAYISGGNSYDGSVYPYSGVPAACMTALLGTTRQQIAAEYQLQNPGFDSLSYQHLFGDMRYVLAGSLTSEAMQHIGVAGYRYFYANGKQGQPGAHHGSEVDALFKPAKTQAIAQMQRYWRNFIESGNPNSADLPQWQAVNNQDENWLVIDQTVHLEPQVREEKLTLLKQAYKQRVQPLM